MTMWVNYIRQRCDICGRTFSRPNFGRHREACKRKRRKELGMYEPNYGDIVVVTGGEHKGAIGELDDHDTGSILCILTSNDGEIEVDVANVRIANDAEAAGFRRGES